MSRSAQISYLADVMEAGSGVMAQGFSERPLILLTNDDGIGARGIQGLAGALGCLGDVVLVAPEDAQSGMSQALTTAVPLRVRDAEAHTPYRQYGVSGTPADCVKLALHAVLDRRPDVVVAGINHGSNASVNVLYSGTMGAALEGCIAGIPSVGFSLVRREVTADLSPYLPYCVQIVRQVLERGLPAGVCLNVNLPRMGVRGVRVCRQANARWVNEFEPRHDPWGRAYYWMTGTFHNLEEDAEDTDDWGLRHGYVTVVPVRVDMTAHGFMEGLRGWQLGLGE